MQNLNSVRLSEYLWKLRWCRLGKTLPETILTKNSFAALCGIFGMQTVKIHFNCEVGSFSMWLNSYLVFPLSVGLPPPHPWCPHSHHCSRTCPGSSWTGRERDRCSHSPRSKSGILPGTLCVSSPSFLDRQGISRLTVPIRALLLLVVLCSFYPWSTTLT